MTTSSNRDGSRRKTRGSAARPSSSPRGGRKPPDRPRRAVLPEPGPAPVIETAPAPGALDAVEPAEYPLSPVERTFATRVPPPEPERPRPTGRRAIFLDVENTSRAQHLAHVIDHLGVDPWDRRTELVAVANWRVVGHEAARLLAARGAHLVHSAPSTGVRDWSDLRIAVAAGIWLAAARPGDLIEIVSDDRAFDAVGDVAASLGIEFRRLSYRRLREQSGEPVAAAIESQPAEAGISGSRRRRRRRGRRSGGPSPVSGTDRRPGELREPTRPPGPGGPHAGRGGGGRRRPSGAHEPRPHAEAPHTTAPHDELVSVVRRLVESSPKRSVSLDAVANALKARGFQRPPGSPRLVTRLRRIREIVVSPSGTITLAEGGLPTELTPRIDLAPSIDNGPTVEIEPVDEVDEDRQPAYLAAEEVELPEVDGNRAEPPVVPPSRGRRRRRRRRGGPRQSVPGPLPA